MEKTIKLILLTNSERLISEIIEMGADIGEPDCKLIHPHEIWSEHNDATGPRDAFGRPAKSGYRLVPWMKDDTDQTEFMISSDKIITITDPNSDLLEKYLEKTE